MDTQTLIGQEIRPKKNTRNTIKTIATLAVVLVYLFVFISCKQKSDLSHFKELLPIAENIFENDTNFYYVDFESYPINNTELPIGIFDSGTGGLTVLDAILRYDAHNNGNRQIGADSVADFMNEKFIYLGDQANMPYGTYSAENNIVLLREHIIKDVQFLLGNKYYQSANAMQYQTDKQPVKAIVIACNTATAYGMTDVVAVIKQSGTGMAVIGVIDAGALGALELLGKTEDASIAVLATEGTVASNGYVNAIERLQREQSYTGTIRVFQQAGNGIAGAVDEAPEYLVKDQKKPHQAYKGPSFDNQNFPINRNLLSTYKFDYSNNHILCDNENVAQCTNIQINSPENYVRYNVVMLMEQIRQAKDAPPLKSVILGCTHYPYLLNIFQKVFDELYNLKDSGRYVYRQYMAEKINFIDPALNTAKELYAHLSQTKRYFQSNTKESTTRVTESEFYISVPNRKNPNVTLDSSGRFTYNYKYGRKAGEIQEYIRVVPFSRSTISDEVLGRFRSSIPYIYSLIQHFDQRNPKLKYMPATERIK